MKRCEFFIIYNIGTEKTALKTKGYMFEKCGHWFTVRHKMLSEKNRKKWIISDFVTGLVMTETDSSIENVWYDLPECSIVKLLVFYDNRTIYDHRPVREELQSYAQMIRAAMFRDNPKSKMLELHQSQAEKLFN